MIAQIHVTGKSCIDSHDTLYYSLSMENIAVRSTEQLSLQSAQSRHDDMVAFVFESFKQTFDLDVSLDLAPLQDDREREEVANDPLLRALIVREVASLKSSLTQGLYSLASSAKNEGVKLSAILKFGGQLYPERFKEETVNMRHSGSVTLQPALDLSKLSDDELRQYYMLLDKAQGR